jgi:cystathionine beta-lyase/cystathionine gamma-synthase
MTHASVPPDHRVKIGITHDLIRFSVGIEDSDDLVEDIRRAVNF